MGQKVNPLGFRLCMSEYSNPADGVLSYWGSYWYANRLDYSKSVLQDHIIRKILFSFFAKATIGKLFISRDGQDISLTFSTVRSGLCIAKLPDLKAALKKALKTSKQIKITVVDQVKPDLSAKLVADNVVRQIEKRVPYKRVVKKAINTTMSMGALGIKIMASGRLAGAEIARSESFKEGAVPLHTLRADIDYCFTEAHTTYGVIGIKVWINRRPTAEMLPDSVSDKLSSGGSNV